MKLFDSIVLAFLLLGFGGLLKAQDAQQPQAPSKEISSNIYQNSPKSGELKILLENSQGGYDTYVTEIPKDPEKLKELLVNMTNFFEAVANAYISDGAENRGKVDLIMQNLNTIQLTSNKIGEENVALQKQVTTLIKNQAKSIFVAIDADAGMIFGSTSGVSIGLHPEIGYNFGNQFIVEGGVGFQTISPASIGLTVNLGLGYWIK